MSSYLAFQKLNTNIHFSAYVVPFQRSISENSLVAMDFSGQKSRVIENPSEALSVAVEEGLSWRVRPLIKLCFPDPIPSTVESTKLFLYPVETCVTLFDT